MNLQTPYPTAELSGTPRQIGLQHGSIFKTQVLASIRCYQEMFFDYAGLEWPQAKKMAARFVPAIQDYDGDYILEMQGVAEGAGVDFEDILALNVRSELVLQAGFRDTPPVDGCTCVVVTPGRSQNGHILAGHNWDWKDAQKKAVVRMRITQSNGKPSIYMITEAGIIGKTGFNSAGLSLFLNALAVDTPPAGVPLHIAMRGILDSTSLTQALKASVASQLGCCANFVIAHKSGEAIDLEISNNDFDVLFPTGGILAHTNHFLSPRLPRPPYVDTFKRVMPDSYLRLHRVGKAFGEANALYSLEDVQGILRDHDGKPDAICRHTNPAQEEGKRLCTLFSIVVDLTAGEIYFCSGNPCENPYEKIQFDA